jgi:hypothetical protein
MPERHLPERDAEFPFIETPVIDIQDLEHQAEPGTRVNSKGVKVEPRMDELPEMDLEKEDEKAREAIAKFEESISKQPPG